MTMFIQWAIKLDPTFHDGDMKNSGSGCRSILPGSTFQSVE